MSDTSILGGVLGLGSNVSYDPEAAKGYLTQIEQRKADTDRKFEEAQSRRRGAVGEAKGYLKEQEGRATKLEGNYDDLVAQRRATVANMQKVVEEATRALLQTRENRVNLPLLAAGSAMMMPTSTGGLGASLGQAGMSAAPFISADRKSNDENIMRMANLKSIPLTMGEAIDRDVGSDISGRLGRAETAREKTMQSVLAMNDSIDKDTAAQLAQRGNVLEQQQGAVTRGVMTAQTTGMKQVQKDLNDLRKQAANEAKNRMAIALRDGSTYEGDDAETEGQLTEALYQQLFKQKYGVWPAQANTGKDATPEEIEKSVPKMPRSIPKETKQERDTYTAISSLGSTSEGQLSALEFAQSDRPQVPGMLAGPALWASRLAEVVGLDGDWGKQIADAGTDVGKMKAIVQGFVLKMQTEQKGVQTEGDAKRMAEAIANVTNTEGLNKLMFSWMRSQALGAKYAADQADAYVKGNKGRASGINAHMNEKGRVPLVRSGPGGGKVTLWDYVQAYTARNPEMKREEAEKKAIEMWNSL
jgi:hypothetical protein